MTRTTTPLGQRTTTNPAGGKTRTPTGTSHGGSRVEPSPIAERTTAVRKTKAARGQRSG
jgi:hypothetical protein